MIIARKHRGFFADCAEDFDGDCAKILRMIKVNFLGKVTMALERTGNGRHYPSYQQKLVL